MAMFAVGGHDCIIRTQCLHDPGCDGLLTDIEVEKTANLFRAVQLDTFLL